MGVVTIVVLMLVAHLAWASECSWDPSEASLECSLRWKRTEVELQETELSFATHQREATRTLKLVCDDTLIIDDNGKPPTRLAVHYDGLRHHQNPWPHLISLEITNCPLATLSLVVNARKTSHFLGDLLLDVIRPLLGGRSLAGLRTLSLIKIADEKQKLDLSSTLWCEAGSNLISLNLSGNGLDRVPSPLNASCQSLQRLEVLNLSENAISTIDAASSLLLFMAATSLTHLDLSRNRIQSFSLPRKMSSLRLLDMSDNKLSSSSRLMKALEAAASTLQELHAQGNQMDLLPGLLSSNSGDESKVNFDSLVVLNLSRNAIGNADKGFEVMRGFGSLVALDLAHNKITKVDDFLLSDLVALQVLSLGHNQIVELSTKSLASLKRLHVLVLSHNSLDERGISGGVFHSLSDLRSLSLDHNRIRNLPSDFLEGCTNLKDLSLSANFLRQWPQQSLQPIAHHLHTLDMGENSLRELEPLEGFEQLYGLRLAGNRLRNLTQDIFADASHIKMLNMADNLIEHIDQGAFEALKHLKALRLDNNRLEDINGLLTAQHHLQWLNMSHNLLQWFDYAIIPKSVIWLSLRHNRIEELANYYNMQDGFHLTHLDIGHNDLVRMDRKALQPSLKEIYADHNRISELAPNMFSDLVNLSVVNLTNNNLGSFPLSAFALSLHQGSTVIWMSQNPLVCDCEMEWIQRINSLAATSPREFPLVGDWANLRCTLNNRDLGLNSTSMAAEVVSSIVRPDEFLCSYETHCFALCMCCDFFACDCRMKCSDGCNCFHDQTWSTNIIECGNRAHKSVPEFVPMDATSLYLDGNDFHAEALVNDEFIGRKHLTSLYLNRSNVALISNQTFKGLSELLVLHLEDNALSRLDDGLEFDELVSLRELYLHNNALEFIHEGSLRPLAKSLQILTLHGNRLKVDFHVWDYMTPRLRSLSLRGNDWTCQCEFVEKFAAGLRAYPQVKIEDAAQVKCFNESTVRNSSTCADVLAVSFKAGGSEAGWASWDSLVPVVAVTAASMIIVVSLIILAFAARKPLKTWFSRRYDSIQRSSIYGTIKASSLASKTKFDILVLSTPEDEDFARHTLSSLLEDQQYRVAYHNNSDGSGLRPPVETSSCVCVVASQHSSYIQNNGFAESLVTLTKLCRDLARPLMFVALETATAKALRRLQGVDLKILLWDTKSFWPTLRSIVEQQPRHTKHLGVSSSSSPQTAVNTDEDLWTYLKSTNNGSGDSSLSTQSTDTMLHAAPKYLPRKASTLRSSQLQQQQLFNSPATLHSRKMHSTSAAAAASMRPPRPRITENPMADSHHRSGGVLEDEPIYHSLEEDDNDVTVYINADLEVVYPSLVNGANLDEEAEEEAELNGLLADCYENEDNLRADYVPSPAPGSYPRGHLSYATANSRRRPPPTSSSYLV